VTQFITNIVAHFGRFSIRLVDDIGSVVVLIGQVAYWAVRPPWRLKNLFKQMEFIGIGSLSIILLTGFFSGAVIALQVGHAFALFNAETLVGATVALAMARELSPVFTALMVTARAGSAMAAEIGSMRVTEQIDALYTMAVEPMQYLLVPRIIACMLVVPLLSILFSCIGFGGAFIVGVKVLGINEGLFVANMRWLVEASDIIDGLIKAFIFGILLSGISCYQGYHARGGAQGVGMATNRAVVFSSVTILISDYFLTDWLRIIRTHL